MSGKSHVLSRTPLPPLPCRLLISGVTLQTLDGCDDVFGIRGWPASHKSAIEDAPSPASSFPGGTLQTLDPCGDVFEIRGWSASHMSAIADA
ncbi:hypothetical protein BaRGS_00001787 [Batillaria attramentaria]|uniref:Uncharacterized protein n=1 Tax=Batillaria attramentaria TaxID=370345 RepID=A0ABD0M598_9CAEN